MAALAHAALLDRRTPRLPVRYVASAAPLNPRKARVSLRRNGVFSSFADLAPRLSFAHSIFSEE
jgi:hypothetical protein